MQPGSSRKELLEVYPLFPFNCLTSNVFNLHLWSPTSNHFPFPWAATDAVINQIKKDVLTYPTDKVDATITSFGVVSRPGGLLNAGDACRFKVKIENKGRLVMTNAKAHVFGTEWTDVSVASGGPYSQGPVENLTNFVVAAFGSYETGWFYGKAKKRCDPDTKSIVLADLGHWDASLQYILDSASMEGPKEGKLDQIVYPA